MSKITQEKDSRGQSESSLICCRPQPIEQEGGCLPVQQGTTSGLPRESSFDLLRRPFEFFTLGFDISLPCYLVDFSFRTVCQFVE